MSSAPFKFSMEKAQEAVGAVLNNRGIRGVKANGILLLDKTGSFKDEYEEGLVQGVCQSVFPFVLETDPDKKMPIFTFGNDVVEHPEITLENWDGYIRNQKLDRDGRWGSFTEYAPVIERALKYSGFISSGLFGAKYKANAKDGYPVVGYLGTDGANRDADRVWELMDLCREHKMNFYLMCLGLDTDGREPFVFLRDLADEYPNVGFARLQNIERLLETGEFYSRMVPQEMADWLREKRT